VRPRAKQAHLHKKLLRIRKALRLSQNEMLQRLGLEEPFSRQNISDYENGKLEPPLFVLLKYAQIAGVCTDVLIDDTLKMPQKIPSTPDHRPQARKLGN
jgi:transcriptional regulator with XRE-family HTH domain